jgi:hypothetical protein
MKRKRGRPTLFNAGLAARLCRLLERGSTTRACCESERVGLRTFFDWRSRHGRFARATRRARVTHRRNMMVSVRPVTLAELRALLAKADDIDAAAGYTKVGQE